MRSIFIVCMLVSVVSSAQEIIDVPLGNGTIILDGKLEENAWNDVLEFSDFKQIDPNIGTPASEQVIVKILYDKEYLYVGGIINFRDPSQIFATTLERDVAQVKDDYFQIHIDTYNDKINTLIFRTNPLSARQDMEVSRNGEEFNTSWNTFWNVKSSITEKGWSTEMRIPFSSLRYEKSSENIMRIKATVKYKEINERITSHLKNIDIGNALHHFTNAQEIRFTGLPVTKPLYITPYIKANAIRENLINEEGTAYKSNTSILERKQYADHEVLDKVLSNLGVDVKFKPNANHTIDFTLNTDFAEVEADDRIVNISRFPIFLNEKRLFFLENADIFNSNQFDHRLFHSRRIGIQDGASIPIIGGVRFTGGNTKWQYGLLSMQTHEVDEVAASANKSVTRIKKNIGELGSYIGFINTNSLSSENYNHLMAVDANIRLTNTVRTQLTVGTTFDKEKGDWKPMYGASINTFKNNGFGLQYRFREYTENFDPKLGFVSQPNTKRLTLNHGWRKSFTNHSFLQFFSIGHYFRKNWLSNSDHHDFFQTNFYMTAIHKKGHRLTMFFPIYQEDNLYSDWEIAEGVTVPAAQYKMWKFNPIFISGDAKPYKITLDTEIGEFYGGNQFTISYNVSYDFSKLFQAQLGGTYNNLRFPDEYASETSRKLNLSRYFSRLKFNLSSKTSLNSYVQYDTRSDQLGWNLRFRYNPTEGTDLYVVYNHNANTNRNALQPRLPFTDNQILIIKFSKTFIR
ncbi:carbohydrate binding family 9 domain-containing protein [Aquimarina megaterium]|uniref:carbohydrate binding family 9 domain-containing protein n=1 Tax=Aquimarina megaterium TaxID=1443666 RepID=UPI0004B253C2|nr:carbohydrate binding family 9 domain-containing protein [Aquimarina megaterium]